MSPSMRRHVVGNGGKALRNLEMEFEGLRVTVPPPEDKETHHVCLEGPKEQVAAAAAVIARRVEEEKQRVKKWRASLAKDAKDSRNAGKPSTPKGTVATRTG